MDIAKKKVLVTAEIYQKFYKDRPLYKRIYLDAKIEYYQAMEELKIMFTSVLEFENWMIENIGDDFF